MPLKPENIVRMQCDAVERKKLAELKAMTPEYADLELYQIAHLELKEKLLEKIREILKKKSATPNEYAAVVQAGYRIWYGLVRKLTILLYKFQNRIHLCTDF